MAVGRVWVFLVGLIFPIHCPGSQPVLPPKEVPEPIQGMISYPSNEWFLSDMHWLGKSGCQGPPCEAGYHTYGFMAFVRKYGSGDQEYVRISADAERCSFVSMTRIGGPGYVKLTDKGRFDRVAQEVQAQVDLLKPKCGNRGLEQPVQTKGLEKLFAKPN